MRQFVAYRGSEFTIEWYHDLEGTSAVSVKEKKIVITNAFVKKQDKLPNSEKERALIRKKNYEKRVEEGTYYDP